jgi:hypothetical protein
VLAEGVLFICAVPIAGTIWSELSQHEAITGTKTVNEATFIVVGPIALGTASEFESVLPCEVEHHRMGVRAVANLNSDDPPSWIKAPV